MYHKAGGKLLGHFDSPHLFERPIVALELFSEKKLDFGVKGPGMQPQKHHHRVPMPRGSLTIMEGYAANVLNHGVRPVKEKAASLLLRRMHPSLLSREWLDKNTVRVDARPVFATAHAEPCAKRRRTDADSTVSTHSCGGESSLSSAGSDGVHGVDLEASLEELADEEGVDLEGLAAQLT